MADKTLAFLIANLKRNLRIEMLNNEDLVFLLSPTVTAPLTLEDVLLGCDYISKTDGKIYREQGYILDYMYVPDTTTLKNKLFICMEANADNIESGMMSDLIIEMAIFTHKDNVILTEQTKPKKSQMNSKKYIGNRVDIGLDIIERFLKGSKELGLGQVLPLKRGFMEQTFPTSEFYGKKVRYVVKGYSPREVDSCGN